MTDEFLSVVARLWSGELVKHRGEWYRVDVMQLEPVADGRIPVWSAGGSASGAPRRRAAPWDGFVPASDGWPDAVIPVEAYRSMAEDIGSMRAGGLDGFDLVVIGNADGTRPTADEVPAYVDAGATWVLTQAFTVEDARARIAAGPGPV